MIFCDCQYEIHLPCISSKVRIKLTMTAKNIQLDILEQKL